ncbi:energy-coupling factor ABC transporter ATP-binding protein [Natronincola ferrireducens]|uniref:Energy-coupling factor transport system ATP-binding protein n=1 Tax=Natronincola ferrireducens TaxID=393762 RepID=A0A1G8ZN68_9FIRM|nr:ABC transporter ATP-binding protein [Natronincola ferrireducens]SDK16572.1 energy-coupling factor transport system ATP-binding protein [Natronincola ferrireducens]
MTWAIEIRNLTFRYPGRDTYILQNVNLKIKQGETVAIVGLSGNGKSTLCYCISGIIPHIYGGDLQGEVFLFDQPIKDLKRSEMVTKIGIVFQDPDTQLFSPTVEDEVAFGPENLCLDRWEIDRRIEEALKVVGMENHRLSNPNHLSGGQKQLVALASVLSLEPDIFVFDEAVSQVDKDGKLAIKNKILTLKKEKKTIIMVEHDFTNLDIADRVVVLKEGRLQEFEGWL